MNSGTAAENHSSNGSKVPDITDPLARKIYALAQLKPKGISDKDIALEMPKLPPVKKAEIINKFLSQGIFELFKQGGSLLYKLKDPSKSRIPKGADSEEKIVYAIIEEAGNKGIWIRDIRYKSNLPLTQLDKILKSLENKKIIKAVKSVAAAKKKVYMLYNLQPDCLVTGGAWYHNQEFETDFVDLLNQQCYQFLESKRDKAMDSMCGPIAARNGSYASSKEVLDFISELKISKIELSVADLEEILNTLIYDGKVEKTITAKGKLYRAVNSLLDSPGLVKNPCGVCPIRKNCCSIGDITPIKCEYLKEWLDR